MKRFIVRIVTYYVYKNYVKFANKYQTVGLKLLTVITQQYEVSITIPYVKSINDEAF